jgi:fructose-1,6-bisphosphatase/inositol monophosphatase family enzyme
LWKGGEPIYGLLYFPRSLDKYFHAIKGEGSFDQDNRQISLKPKSSYKPSFSWDTPDKNIKPLVINEDFGFRVSYRMYGAATYSGYCLARGSHDFYVAYEMSIWDLGAIIPIAQEIGYVVDYLGKPITFNSEEIDKYKFKVLIAKPDIHTDVKPHVESIIGRYEAASKTDGF